MDQSDMPDFPDMGMFPYALGKLLRKPGGKGLGLFEDTMVHKFIQDAMSRRAAQRISCIRVAVDKSLVLAVIRIKSIVDSIRRERDGHRQITAGKSFGNGHDIRRDSCMVTGK